MTPRKSVRDSRTGPRIQLNKTASTRRKQELWGPAFQLVECSSNLYQKARRLALKQGVVSWEVVLNAVEKETT